MRRRREAAAARARGRRRLLVLVLAVLGILVALVVTIGGGRDGDGGPSGPGKVSAARPAELPRGGKRIFPRFRVVAFYGAPQDAELGALGIGTPDQAGRRLLRQARGYRDGGRRVLPAFELIAVVANGGGGAEGLYRTRQSAATIRRYLAAARRAKALLLLDIQPGRSDFIAEMQALEPFLSEPDVGLALDPEWHVGPGEIPGKVIGSVDAGVVNAVSARLAQIVRERRLPDKLLVVHQFTADMVRRRATLLRRPGVPIVLDVDGFGSQPDKIAKYRELTRGTAGFANGLKLFYREDRGLMSPAQALHLRPQPQLVLYE